MKNKREKVTRKNFVNIERGLIPWSSDEFNKITRDFHELLQKPMDDWNLKKCQFSIIDDESGEEEIFQINPFNNLAQFSELMLKRYPDEVAFMAHSLRHVKIIKFIKDNEKALIKEGFLIQEEMQSAIKKELIEALCFLPFSLREVSEDGEEEFRFSYQEVVDKTWEIIKKNCDDGRK